MQDAVLLGQALIEAELDFHHALFDPRQLRADGAP